MALSPDSEKLKREFLRDMGQRLRQAREQADFTVESISPLLGTTENVYRKIEAGKFLLTVDMMVIVRRLFDISLDWLFTGEVSMPEPIVHYYETSLENGMMGVNQTRLTLYGLCILFNAAEFDLSSAVIVQEDSVFHLLGINLNDELIFEWQSDDLEEAKRVFIEHLGGRYFLDGAAPQASWSELYRAEKEGIEEINLDAMAHE